MFIVVMSHSWGKASSLEAADKVARLEGGHGKKKMKRLVFQFDEEKTKQAYVDQMGRLCWEGERPVQLEE